MTDSFAHTAESASANARPKLPPSSTQSLAAGRALRKRMPRRQLGALSHHDRRPLEILAEQNSTRLQDLIPLRNERMSQSPFTFYRGTAALMAADLAADVHTDILVPSCGDAHVSNFGFYASPQRSLVFDLNDFDEAAAAPAEWDVKRLITSAIIGGRHAAYPEKTIERHMIEELIVAVLLAGAVLRHQERRARHAFHAAGDDDVAFAGEKRLARHGDGLQAGAAHLV